VTGLGLTSANDAPERDPASFVLSGSNDGGATFTEIASGGIPVFGDRFELQEVFFANDAAYTTYALVFPTVADEGGANSMQIAEIELLGTLAGGRGDLVDISQPDNAVVPTSDNHPGGEHAGLAIDDNDQTKYLNFDKLNTGLTITTSGGVVTGLGLTSANDAPERDPASFVLSGSNDGGATFTEIASGDIPAFGDRFELQEVFFANDAVYTTYALVFPTVANEGGANSMQIAEIELLGIPDGAKSTEAVTVPTIVDFGLLTGDATYVFFFNAIKVGASTAIAGNDAVAIKLDQWNQQGVFGTTVFGVADNVFTAVEGKSVESVFDRDVHVVVVNDTGAEETRLYVNGDHVGVLPGNFELSGEAKVMGARINANTDPWGEGSVMHSWATYNRVLTDEQIAELAPEPEAPAPAELPWSVGLNDDAWPAGDGGGPNTTFVQETGSNELPGNPANGEGAREGDDDYYWAGDYSTVIAGNGDYTPLGKVMANEESAERAFAGTDNDLRYHFNLPDTLESTDRLTVSYDALNLHGGQADSRYGIEVYFNNVQVQSEIVIRDAELGQTFTTEAFTLADVNAEVGSGYDNIITLKGVNYNAEGGGNWMGIDYVQLSQAAPAPDLASGLVAHWPLDEIVEGTTSDVIGGYDMEATNLNADNVVAGKVGNAISFSNADNTLLSRVHGSDDDLPANKHDSFTVSFWSKVQGNGQNDLRVFSESNTEGNNNPLFNIGTRNNGSDGTIDVYIRNSGWPTVGHIFSTAEPFDGEWHHVVFVQDNLERSIYVDGVLDDLAIPAKPESGWDNLNATTIGGILRGTASHWVTGVIDEVAIWKRALSAEETVLLHNQGLPGRAEAGLVAHFPLDSDGDSSDGGFKASKVADVTFGTAGATAATGTSATFNGTSSIVQHDWSADLNPEGSFTLALWARSDGGAGAWHSPVTSRHDLYNEGQASQGYLIYDNNPSGVWTFWSGNGTVDGNWQILNGPAVNIGEWDHLAIVYDSEAEMKKLYVNGALEAESNDIVAPNDTTPLNIGAGQDHGTGFWFKGDLDDLGIWNIALSQEEIQDVMNNGVVPGDGPPPAPALSIVNNGDGTVTVTFEGRLEAAASVNGPWQDTGATSPLTTPADAAMQYARAVND